MGKGGLGNNCIHFRHFPDIFSGTKLSSPLQLHFKKHRLYNLHFFKDFLFLKMSNSIFSISVTPLCFSVQAPWDQNQQIVLELFLLKNKTKQKNINTSCNYYKSNKYSPNTLLAIFIQLFYLANLQPWPDTFLNNPSQPQPFGKI